MICQSHPYRFVSELAVRMKRCQFEFSRYVYRADRILDERECFRIPGCELTESWVDQQIRCLREDQELAIHSRVFLDGEIFHIPMVDFSPSWRGGRREMDRFLWALPSSRFGGMALFYSGRSYQAYFTNLITARGWREFMGRLLLVNKPDEFEVVDSRWVGHRLIAGYGSLRWSHNSGLYNGVPKRVFLSKAG